MQELALNIGASTATGNLFLGLAGQKPGTNDQKVSDKFIALLQIFAGARPMPDMGAEGAEGELPSGVVNARLPMPGAVNLELDTLVNINPEGLAAVGLDKISLAIDPENPEAVEIPPELMAQLVALFKNFPELQAVLNSKADLHVVAEALDYLQATKTPDLSQFKLPEDVKEILLKLSANRPLLAEMGEVIHKIEQSPELIKAARLASELVEKPAIVAVDTKIDPAAAHVAVAKEVPVKDAEKAASHNVLAEARAVVETLSKPNRADKPKLMTDIAISASGIAAHADASIAANESNSLAFDQALTQAMHAADALQNGKHNIMSAAGIEAYALRQATGGVPAHIASMQVAVQLQRNIQQRTNNFFIQLQPEELGRIEVTLKFEGSRVRALISAEKEETLQLLKDDAKALDRALQGSGVETDAGSLEFSLGQNFNRFNEAHKNHHDRSFGTMIADTDLNMDTKQDLVAAHIMVMAEGRVDVKL